MRQIFTIIFLLFVTSIVLHAQSIQVPVIGKPMPAFELTSPDGRKINNKTTEGRPVIMMFFGKACLGSFKLLPKLDQFYKKYKQDVEFITVAVERSDSVQRAYRMYQKSHHLTLPVIVDAKLPVQLGVSGMPILIWINASGIVQAITFDIVESYVHPFANKQSFDFIDSSEAARNNRGKRFDPAQPFMVNDNGATDSVFLQRSIISQWTMGTPSYTVYASVTGENPLEGLQSLQVLGRTLSELYRIAYWGRSYRFNSADTVFYNRYLYEPILELADTTHFTHHSSDGKRFCYTQTLAVDKRTPENMMRRMQQDLHDYFGYEVTTETRVMPCYKLVASDSARKFLRAKAKPERSSWDNAEGGRLTNVSVSQLIRFIYYGTELDLHNLPIIDATGIKHNIEINLHAPRTDLDAIRNELRKSGLDIVRAQHPFKVLVIRDPISKSIK